MSQTQLADRADAMRLAFDRAFAQEARRDTAAMENFLGFQAGPESCALSLSEIAGLFVDRRITPLPGGVAGLLGIAGFRGSVVPVYDLHVLLGHPPGSEPRWLVIAKGASVAFAFETFVGHFQIARDAILPAQSGGRRSRLVQAFAPLGEEIRPIVGVGALLDAVREQLPANTGGNQK